LKEGLELLKNNGLMKNKILSFLKDNWILLLILAVGLFLRLYNGKEWFVYDHDQDLAGWVIRDIVLNQHLRLIGQLTSTPGVFIGPLFYYLLIPFYLAFNWDPLGGVFLVAILGLFAIWGTYFTLSKIFNKNVGLIGAILYAVSPYIVFNDRRVVPTMPLMIWSTWFLYCSYLIIKGNQKKGFLLAAVLIALIWHINFGLAILLPILLIALILSKKKIDFKALAVSLITLVILFSPFIAFEARHGFSQTKAVFLSATVEQGDVLTGVSKVAKIYDVVTKNISGILWGYPGGIPKSLAFWVAIGGIVVLVFRKKVDKKLLAILAVWFLMTTVFFSLYSKPVSEYYLDSLTAVWILFIALFIELLMKSKKLKIAGWFILAAFVLISFKRFANYIPNNNGYVERRAAINYIKNDALSHGYPCVSLSYITGSGYNFGYRYFIWMDGVSVREVSTNAPVYSIVFPLSLVDSLDRTFGGVGVINPDYSIYNKEGIAKSCQGENVNLVGSMFGYTE
jgi:4-amino-4-deoxy-L-arabinose transferase-like glycosyltransferase